MAVVVIFFVMYVALASSRPVETLKEVEGALNGAGLVSGALADSYTRD
jgi:hypothetical protein